jgi:8-oxo-dGTP diphosphatase
MGRNPNIDMNRISVRAIIEHAGKFLLVRHTSMPDFWCLPGGRVETGESVFEALKRELVEEMNIKPEIGNLVYIHQIKEKDGYSSPGFFFHVKNTKDFLNHDAAISSHGKAELVEVDWVDIATANVLPEFLSSELPDIAREGFSGNTRIRLTHTVG